MSSVNIIMPNKSLAIRKWGLVILAPTLVIAITCFIFKLINETQPIPYLDEVFHIPQAIKYCAGRFHEWDPKITTLPGLYLISAGVLAPMDLLVSGMNTMCTTQNLRAINLMASFINLYLLYDIRRKLLGVKAMFDVETMLFALTLWSFPVLYFFTFLYYTDTLATGLVLLAYSLHLRGRMMSAAAIGAVATIVRQTNIVWLVFLALQNLPYVILKINSHRSEPDGMGLVKMVYRNIKTAFGRGLDGVCPLIKDVLRSLGGYVAVGVIFAVFVYVNKGIVVGDRTAHEATLHFMQLCYFATVISFFCFPYFLMQITPFVNFILKNLKISVLIVLGLFALIYFNTIAHPYLLADNRHYVFYIWRRLFTRSPFLLVPIYFFGIFGMGRLLKTSKITFRLAFILCLVACLVPQKLLEFRYFIIPYLIFHLQLKPYHWWQTAVEFILHLAVNALTVYIFVTRPFLWPDQLEIQRFLW